PRRKGGGSAMVLQLGAERRLQRLQLRKPPRAAAAARDVAQQALPPHEAQLSVDERMEQGRGAVTLHVDSPWARPPWRTGRATGGAASRGTARAATSPCRSAPRRRRRCRDTTSPRPRAAAAPPDIRWADPRP